MLTVRRDSGGNYRIFRVNAGTTATISGLTITNGGNVLGGGGINNSGTLVVADSAVVGNSAFFGGGISSDVGSLTVRDSTIAGNTATGSTVSGGIEVDSGTATIQNTTIVGNTANSASAAGGILVGAGTTTLANSTIAANTNTNAGGAANVRRHAGVVNVTSTIVAGPLGGSANCSGTIVSQGFNLESADSCGFGQATDQPSTDPVLGALQGNGGPTQTMALPLGSPAIDKGLAAAGMTGDQRGLGRPVDSAALANAAGGDGTDVGAFEVQDTDGDGDDNAADNCPDDPNPSQANIDGDALGDACDPRDDRVTPPDGQRLPTRNASRRHAACRHAAWRHAASPVHAF